jgi:SpoVK/Ycf46/Vps4 family AAA+-type ATPase
MELAVDLLGPCDADEIARRTEGFTPADFSLAGQRAAQLAFERALAGGSPELSASDCIEAVERTRPSVTSAASAAFESEATSFARL